GNVEAAPLLTHLRVEEHGLVVHEHESATRTHADGALRQAKRQVLAAVAHDVETEELHDVVQGDELDAVHLFRAQARRASLGFHEPGAERRAPCEERHEKGRDPRPVAAAYAPGRMAITAVGLPCHGSGSW